MTSKVPPGTSTLAISRRAPSHETILRSPKATVTASKAAPWKGKWSASAHTNGSAHFRLATSSIGRQKSPPTTSAPGQALPSAIARSPLPVARSRILRGCFLAIILAALDRQRKSAPPLRKWFARSYRPAMDAKAPRINSGSLSINPVPGVARSLPRPRASPWETSLIGLRLPHEARSSKG